MKLNEVDTKAGLNKAFQIAKDRQQAEQYDDGGPYTAASLYLKAERGATKPQIAKQLSELTGIDLHIAVLMIDAIDAYEDIRDSHNMDLST